MSFEIGHESRAAYSRGSRRAIGGYPGLGATAVQTLTAQVTAQATAPWMVGLPKAGDSKDNTRIAYAKRDHDLALTGNATAYANLKAQAAGSATKVGKAWYNAALNDVNNARVASAPKPIDPLYNPAGPPTRQIGWKWTAPSGPWVMTTPVNVNPILPGVQKIPYNPAILKEAADMGLKIQQTTDGSVVAVNSAGAVVSKPLPLSTSQVTDSAIVSADAVQANAPPPRPRAASSGIFSILDKLTQQSAPTSSSSDNFVASQGPPAPTTTTPDATINTADVSGASSNFGAVFQNPTMLIGLAVGVYLLFSTSSGRKR